MNKRISKIVAKFENGTKKVEVVSVRRDQIKKAIEEGAFDYFISRGYDEVYDVKPVQLEAKLENIREYWLNEGKMWANFNQETKMLQIVISYGYAYMELWVNTEDKKETEIIETEVIEEVATTQENNTTVEINLNSELDGVELTFNCKPQTEVITSMKEAKFHYNRKTKVWYCKQSKESLKFADDLAAKLNDNIIDEVEVIEVDADIKEWNDTSTKYELINFKGAKIIETLDKNIIVECLVPLLNKNCNIVENNKCIDESSSLNKFKIQKIAKLN